MFFLLFPFLPRVLVLKQQAWEERYLGLDLKNSQGPALGQQWNFKTKFADSFRSALTGHSSNTNNFVKDFINKTYRVFIKYCVFFSKNSRKFATSPSPALGCYWLYKKLPANRSDCTIALRWELYSDVGEVAVKCEKHNFSWTPCSFSLSILICGWIKNRSSLYLYFSLIERHFSIEYCTDL